MGEKLNMSILKRKKFLIIEFFGILLFILSLLDKSKESPIFLSYSKQKLLLLSFQLIILCTVFIIHYYFKNREINLQKYKNNIHLKNISLFIIPIAFLSFIFLLKVNSPFQTYVIKSSYLIIFLLLILITFSLEIFKYSFLDLSKVLTSIALLFLFYIAISMGLNQSNEISYIAINGDFQTYNGIRRLLDSQIPYRDFTYYLGLGPLYITSLLQLIIGNNFQMSLFATTFLCYLFSIITCIFIFKIITKKWNLSIYSTLLIFTTFQYHIFMKKISETYFPKLFPFFYDIFKISNTSHSYRPARAFVVVLFAIIFYLFLSKPSKLKEKINQLNFIQRSALIGAIASPLILWSNDFGIASYIAFSFTFFITLVRRKDIKKIFLGTILYSVSTLITLFFLVSLLTFGHFTDWLKTTLQTSSYQSWYYGNYGNATFLFSDITKTLNISILFLMIVWNIYLVYKHKKDDALNLTILFMATSYFIAGYMYDLFSGSAELFIYSNNFIFLILIALFLKGISYHFSKFFNFSQAVPLITFIFLITVFINLGVPIYTRTQSNGIYNQQLHGYMQEHGNELNTLIDYTNEAQVFSTYASAYETILNQYQPTRYDYIIHVLGDDARKEYLNNFLEGKYPFVLTITEDYTYWEDWVWRANWFFYRELYQHYQPTYTIGYNNIWEPSDDNSISTDQTTLSYEYLTPYQVLISINSSIEENLIADVKLSYQTEVQRKSINPIRTLLFADLGQPKEEVAGFNLPPQADEYYIPIEVENGYGSILLDLRPNDYGTININSIELVNLFEQSLNNIQSLEVIEQ